MPLQFQQIADAILSAGIDARSAENQIDPGYVRDALNAEPVQKHLRKRHGYQGYAGNLPVRIGRVGWEFNPSEICFTLDTSLTTAEFNLLNIRSSPIVVHGRLSGEDMTAPFSNTTDVTRYYPVWHQKVRKTFNLNTNTLEILNAEHGMSTSDVFMEVSQSSDPTLLSHSLVEYDALRIDTSTYKLSVDYTNNTGSAFDVFVYYLAKNAVSGDVYKSPMINVTAGSTVTTVTTAIDHGLSNYNIVPRLYRVEGSEVILSEPDSLTIDTVTGEVTWTVTNNNDVTANYYIILSRAPSQNTKTGALSLGTYTITVSNPDTPFIFPGVYLINGSALELVIPDAIIYDALTNETSITFENTSGSGFRIYYEFGNLRSNQVCVYDDDLASITSIFADTRPQLTLWGLDHSEIYANTASDRKGWVNHVDSFRVQGENRIIAGIGGNMYADRQFSEMGVTRKYGSSIADLGERILAYTKLAPVFWETGELPGRSRGFITGTGLSDNWATVTEVAYDSGYTRYDLTIPALSVQGTLSTIISTTTGLEDYLSVNNMSYSRHNGTFKIRAVSVAGNVLSVYVDNSSVTTSDYDDDGVAGRAGIFTDRIVLADSSPFIPGDTFVSDAFPSSILAQCVSTSDDDPTALVINGVTDIVELSSGIEILGKRTSNVIPVRVGNDPDSSNFVRGDMVGIAGYGREFRVLYVNTNDKMFNVGIQSDGTTATVTLQTGDVTDRFQVGMAIMFRRAGVYTGTQIITEIIDQQTFQFASQETATVTTAELVGHTLHLDESIEWQDSSADDQVIQVTRRFQPIEAPDDTIADTPNTYIRYLDSSDATSQELVRSVMASDNMYFTNYEDEVQKFDGTSIYRAGLPNWQPGVFIQQDTSASAKIVTDLRTIAYTSLDTTAGRIEVAGEETLYVLPVGTSILLPGDTVPYTIEDTRTTSGPVKHYIYLDRKISSSVSASGTAREVVLYKYYYRITAVDANNNVIASAVSQSDDYAMYLGQDAAIYHRLVGFPAWDNYDYDSMYLTIYRANVVSGQTATPVFYKLPEKRKLTFGATDRYIEYTDTFSDSNLTETDEINVATGGELGIGWQEPLRARYITSAANTVILGNIRDYPQLDIQLDGASTISDADLGGKRYVFKRDTTAADSLDPLQEMRYKFMQTSSGDTVTRISETPGSSFKVSVPTSTAVGAWVYIYWPSLGTSGQTMKYTGWWKVLAVSGSGPYQLDIQYSGSGDTLPSGMKMLIGDVNTVPVPIGTDGNMGQVSGNLNFPLQNAAKRMSLAINATMRQLSSPWMMSRGGNDVNSPSRLIVRQPRVDATTLGVSMPDSMPHNTFINSVLVSGTGSTPADALLFPSRILAGYTNRPEMFDSPTEVLDSDSDSAIDINPSDGQEITGIVPFFGESAFGASQQSSVVVVFKENSIYLVDINVKRAGTGSPVQRIETEGVGCTAPGSIAVTKGGIMFANQSGIYVLRRNLQVEYIGKFMERHWTNRVDRSLLSQVQGHHFNTGRQYKLSVPILDSDTTNNSEVFVYDHSNENDQGLGAWVRYNAHPATGWCNLGDDSFFASTSGRVFIRRSQGDESDYRDDNQQIDMVIELRPNDFGLSGIRKVLESITAHYRTEDESTGTVISFAVDTQDEYQESTPFRISRSSSNGIGDTITKGVVSIRHSANRRRGIYFSIQVRNKVMDEGVELAGLEYRVAALGKSAARDAKTTQ